MSWKTVPTTSSPRVSCAEMYACTWGVGRGEGGWLGAWGCAVCLCERVGCVELCTAG